MAFLFYLHSFVFFAPTGLYRLLKFKELPKIVRIILVVFFSLKSFFDVYAYISAKELWVLAVISIILSLCLYRTAFINKKTIKQIFNEEIERVNAMQELSKNKKTSKKYSNPDYEDIEAYKYLNTGEIYTFEYMGANDTDFKTRNIVVEHIYEKNGNIYIDGTDIDIDEFRTFRLDRILWKKY